MIRYSLQAVRDQLPIKSKPFHQYIVDGDTVWTDFYRTESGYLLRFPDLADFEVSLDGCNVTAYPTDDADAATVEHLYINQLIPLALSRQGRPTFHASVVTIPGGAIAFLGRTGMGKSTLAASFALQESEFLSDDALLIEETDDVCVAQPSHASVRLWDDSVAALVDNVADQSASISYSDKTRLLAGDSLTYSPDPEPLVAAYLLQSKDATEIEIFPLSGVDRYMAWVQNSFLLDVEDPELIEKHFDWTHRIAGKVPTFQLDYPRDYGMLPDVRRALRQHAANAGN